MHMANGPAPALARHMHRHVPLLRALPLYLLLSAERGLRLVCGVQDGLVDASGNTGGSSRLEDTYTTVEVRRAI